jgi:hypothetical protein
VVVGSEPLDDEPGWVVIPDRSLVSSAGATCSVTTLRTQGA